MGKRWKARETVYKTPNKYLCMHQPHKDSHRCKKTPEKPTKFLKGGKEQTKSRPARHGKKSKWGEAIDHRTQQALEKHQQRRSNRRARYSFGCIGTGSRKKRQHRRGQGGRMEELLRGVSCGQEEEEAEGRQGWKTSKPKKTGSVPDDKSLSFCFPLLHIRSHESKA